QAGFAQRGGHGGCLVGIAPDVLIHTAENCSQVAPTFFQDPRPRPRAGPTPPGLAACRPGRPRRRGGAAAGRRPPATAPAGGGGNVPPPQQPPAPAGAPS